MPSFQLHDEQAIRISQDQLRGRTIALFEKIGLPAEDARLAADVLISADLRGVDTHGAANLMPWYLNLFREGTINPCPVWHVVHETITSANIDSDKGLGLVIVPKAMQIAIQKARDAGVGFVTIHNGRHLGMAQYHALLAVPHDMIGICLTASGPLMVPTFGREPRLGTNPIAVAAPCGEEPTFVYDAATTVVAGNKIIIAHRLGEPLPPGILANDDGTPIMRSISAPTNYSRLLPLGSTPEMASHKGYGLACVVEILTNVLGGLRFGAQLDSSTYNHCVAAINVSAFSDVDSFKQTMDSFVRTLRETLPATGQERVLVPGQLEWETEKERQAKGIPLHPDVVNWFDRICSDMGI